MRVVADTSIMVSALLWSGPPNRLLRAAERGLITLYTSPILIDELEDPEDDAVLACAVAARAPYIVSGDAHLLTLKRYQSIHIVSPRTFLTNVLRLRH